MKPGWNQNAGDKKPPRQDGLSSELKLSSSLPGERANVKRRSTMSTCEHRVSFVNWFVESGASRAFSTAWAAALKCISIYWSRASGSSTVPRGDITPFPSSPINRPGITLLNNSWFFSPQGWCHAAIWSTVIISIDRTPVNKVTQWWAGLPKMLTSQIRLSKYGFGSVSPMTLFHTETGLYLIYAEFIIMHVWAEHDGLEWCLTTSIDIASAGNKKENKNIKHSGVVPL